MCAAVLAAGGARAQTPPSAVAARALLIEQAEQAREREDHGEALALAVRAGRIEMTASLRMFIAEEQLATRSFAAALASSVLCLRDAGRDPQLRNRDAILTRCREVNQRARGSVALLTLQAPASGALTALLDDAPVPAELFDAPQPLDPGAHRLVVRAEGREDHEESFTVREGESRTLALTPGPARVASTAPRVAPPELPPPPPAPAPAPPPREAPRRDAAGPWALGAVGVLGLVGSAVFFAMREASAQGCDIGSDPSGTGERVWRCDDAAQVEAVGQRGTWTALAAVSLGVGLLSAGGGLVWWMQRPRVQPVLSARSDGATVGVEGRW